MLSTSEKINKNLVSTPQACDKKKAATAKEEISCRPGGFVFTCLTVSIK